MLRPISVAICTLIFLGFHGVSAASQNLVESAVPIGGRNPDSMEWIELGTNGGPIAVPNRSEPAHLLLWAGSPILVDVGDGAAGQLAKVGVSLSQIDTIFLSHLHFDHTGGLFAILGLRYQSSGGNVGPLTIYGPPGTKQLVAGLQAATGPGSALMPTKVPEYEVVELTDGATVRFGKLVVTAVENSHYDLWKKDAKRPVSLSYRFDLPLRSIVYTGDTGPSEKVEKLARDADLLVSEIMDADTAMELLENDRPDMPTSEKAFINAHFTKQHLLPDEVGKLAARANVKCLVLTHFGANTSDPKQIPELTNRIALDFGGPIVFANDLQHFDGAGC